MRTKQRAASVFIGLQQEQAYTALSESVGRRFQLTNILPVINGGVSHLLPRSVGRFTSFVASRLRAVFGLPISSQAVENVLFSFAGLHGDVCRRAQVPCGAHR